MLYYSRILWINISRACLHFQVVLWVATVKRISTSGNHEKAGLHGRSTRDLSAHTASLWKICSGRPLKLRYVWRKTMISWVRLRLCVKYTCASCHLSVCVTSSVLPWPKWHPKSWMIYDLKGLRVFISINNVSSPSHWCSPGVWMATWQGVRREWRIGMNKSRLSVKVPPVTL